MIYRTEFTLSAPVTSIDEANAYLQDDEMAKYLIDNLHDDRENTPETVLASISPENIVALTWTMVDEKSGHIDLETNKALSPEQLYAVSQFVSGQNSDGLGEGFEQQSFAEYFNEYEFGYAERDYEDELNSLMDEVREEFEETLEENGTTYTESDVTNEAHNRMSSSRPCESEFTSFAHFDWETNKYEFHEVKEREKSYER